MRTPHEVTIVKKDGLSSVDIKAFVQQDKIFIDRGDLLIEPGYLVKFKTSNGGEETYEVIDPGFYEGRGLGFKSHYQMKVRKLGLLEDKKEVQSTTINVTGTGARVNQNSIDNSVNIINVTSEVSEHILKLRDEIEKLKISDAERQAASEAIDEVENQFKSGNPIKSVVSILLKALPKVANIATIVSAILLCV